jgi:methylmalonyl-CoA mutase
MESTQPKNTQEAAATRSGHPIRIVTAASLFDGHDAAINIMRRILQRSGCEIIHLGHDRSVDDVVNCAIEEDTQAIAMTSYQGGHMEYFKYMKDLLDERGAGHIRIFGGGGGTILPEEIAELHDYGIERIYHPDDGRELGLQGMIDDVIRRCDFPVVGEPSGEADRLAEKAPGDLARLITAAEVGAEAYSGILDGIRAGADTATVPVLGITGTGGAGKSSLVDELVRRFLLDFEDKRMAIVSVDPSKRKTGGALLGDRIRMNAIASGRVYMRSLATRQSNLALSRHVGDALCILKEAGFDLIVLETSGIGQSDTEIMDHSDVALYVMTPEFGAATQLEKIDMLDFADVVAINKFDKRGGADALRDVRKQYKRNHELWEAQDDSLPIFGTIASQFNDPGTHRLYRTLMNALADKTGAALSSTFGADAGDSEKVHVIPPKRTRYLSEIADSIRSYNDWVDAQADVAGRLQALRTAQAELGEGPSADAVSGKADSLARDLDPRNLHWLESWPEEAARYQAEDYIFEVRGQEIRIPTTTKSLSHKDIPKVSVPRLEGWKDLLRWGLQENLPGHFPFTAGIYPFKREGEDPTRMFAGEGGPERTNRRFHYVSGDMPAKRLSTAFDSVTLYGRDPDLRPDIHGKVGNSGVSVCSLDDAKRLYSGFDLCDPSTSVSMTINGPAPMVLAFFLNAAIDQRCEKHIREHGLEAHVEKVLKARWDDQGLARPVYRGDMPDGNDGLGLLLLGCTGDEVLDAKTYLTLAAEALSQVRGTVQADILKEDQAQNTCIFSTEFALRLMGDVQAYFIDRRVRNFYSVSISGYHIAEAGANPITQLAFTLANGFTYVEYYLSRGMDINAFGPNLSFFFSNGIDPEYAVIGRVARRIWAKALDRKYGADERAQKLKYHIQTSGRSLHAQEIDFNDIRTTLQALYAIYDNCNSLHTNAFDEAITTPTESSVRRAIAIQLIINRELGLAKNENPLQGSFIIEELTDLVEEAVMDEFDRLTERGGVLGAMETMYQRSRIQEESLHYETLKHTGEYPIIGVNTYLSKEGSPTLVPGEVIRATPEEKQQQIDGLGDLHGAHVSRAAAAIDQVKSAAVAHDNLFVALMEAVKSCSLGQLTDAMFEVGGAYRRNM